MSIREFRADFEAQPTVDRGASSSARPDAIARNGLTAFSTGPVALSDVTQGLEARPWRLRYEDGDFWISDFTTETLLFSSSVTPIDAISFAFDQGGDPVVAAEVAGDIWIRRYDGLLEDFVFENFGPGRTPIVFLDRPNLIPLSDVQVFFINDGRICHREQRELYAVENQTPAEVTENDYLEVVYRANNSVHVVWSTRNTAAGTWSFGGALSSNADPLTASVEAMPVSVSLVGASSINVIEPAVLDTEAMPVVASLIAASSLSIVVDPGLDTEAMPIEVSLVSASSLDVVEPAVLDTEAMPLEVSLVSGSSRVVVSPAVLETEAMPVVVSLISASSLEV